MLDSTKHFLAVELPNIKAAVADLEAGHYSDSTHDSIGFAADALQAIFQTEESAMNNEGLDPNHYYDTLAADYGR